MDAGDFFDADGNLDIDVGKGKVDEWYKSLDEINQSEETVSVIEGLQSMEPRVVNIIAITQYNADFKLFEIATHIRNAEYNPKRIKAVTLRIKEPKATGLLFSNGKINIVGCKSIDEANKAAKKFRKILSKIPGYEGIKLKSFEISSIVAVINCQFSIAIDRLSTAPGHRALCKYDPTSFAGAIYKIVQPKVTLLIFQSGNIVITGAKSIDDLKEAAEWVYPILKNFKKKTVQEIKDEYK